MLDTLNARLADNIQKLRRKNKLEADFTTLKEEIKQYNKHIGALKAELFRENIDVQKLEKLTFTSLYHRIRGNLKTELDRERQEALAVQLQVQKAEQKRRILEEELQTVADELGTFTDIEAERATLLEEKETFLLEKNDATTIQLLKLSEEIADLTEDISELRKANSAGRTVVRQLRSIIKSLKQAEKWEDWGRSELLPVMLTMSQKDKHINETQEKIRELDLGVSRLKRRVANIKQQLTIGDFEFFADYFFDSFFVDWALKTKIVEARVKAQYAEKTVTQFITKLNHQLEADRLKRDKLQRKHQTIIEQS